MESSDARAFHVSPVDIEDKEHTGQGILGDIYTARHRHWGPVWLKEMAVTTPITTNASKKLRREAEVLKNLRHKNIVQLMGMIWDSLQKYYALVFEPARYGILSEFMEMNPRLDGYLKVALMYDAALGMSYLHSIQPPVIHRDLRWSLVQVHEHFVLKISDFGLAEWINYSRSHSNNRYSQGPTYHIAPECWRDINLKPSWKTDMYSFAVLCWTIAVQEEPYKYLVSPEQIRTAVLDGQRPNLDDLPADCIPELRGWLADWWTQDPEARPRFTDVANVLRTYTQQHDQRIQEAKIRLYSGGRNDGGAAGDANNSRAESGAIAMDRTESLQEEPSSNVSGCAAVRMTNIYSKDLSGSDFRSDQQTSVKRISASATLGPNDLEEDADESPVGNQSSFSASFNGNENIGDQPDGNGDPGNKLSLSTLDNGQQSDGMRRKSSQKSTSTMDSLSTANGAYGMHPSSFTSSSSFANGTFPEWKMPAKSQIQVAGPTSMYETTSDTGKTSVFNFGNVRNIQIGERNLMTVATHKASPKSKQTGSITPKQTNCQSKSVTKKYKITSSKKVIDEKNKDMLTRELGKHWRELARKLKFGEGEIDVIAHDHRVAGLSEIIRQFLRQWEEKMADKATLCAVADALIDLKLYNIAAQLDDSL